MDFKTFFVKRILMAFFAAVTCICVAMAVLGLIFAPEQRFGYQGLLYPLIYGAATMLPGLLSYSKHELSVREAFIRKLLQFVMIEIIVFLIAYSGGSLSDTSLVISLAMSVLLVYTAVHLVLWINDSKTAREFNQALVKMQQEYDDFREEGI